MKNTLEKIQQHKGWKISFGAVSRSTEFLTMAHTDHKYIFYDKQKVVVF